MNISGFPGIHSLGIISTNWHQRFASSSTRTIQKGYNEQLYEQIITYSTVTNTKQGLM